MGVVRQFFGNVLRGDRRRAPRYSVDLTSGALAGGDAEVTIHDLSLTGALIQGERLPETGTSVTLRADTLDQRGVVAWRDGTRAGLRFDRPLSVEQLFTIVHRAQFHPGAGIPAALAA